MTYSERTRDRYRLAVTAVTGLTAAGALTAGGWLAGVAAQTTASDSGAAVPPPAAPPAGDTGQGAGTHPRVLVKQRPQETRVTTRYVTPAGSAAPVGGGGTVTTQTSPGTSQVQAAPPAPAPQPAPAPSSGS
jgi:hypothetical protein